MVLIFPLNQLSRLRLRASAAFWLQSAACAVVAWSLLHGGISLAPAAGTAAANASAAATGASTSPQGTPPAAAATPLPASSMQLAAAPGLAEARLALSTIDVIVTRNDTLDHIFRRLKLNLADLASLRSLPGLRARLDSLRPGEALHFTHRDGELFGLERRLNESQTLRVSPEPTGLKADVLHNPLETRSRP